MQALYIARRVLEYGESGNENIVLTLLDWEKAFDKVDQKKLIEALRRLNVPETMCRSIAAIYENPTFSVH